MFNWPLLPPPPKTRVIHMKITQHTLVDDSTIDEQSRFKAVNALGAAIKTIKTAPSSSSVLTDSDPAA